MPGFFRYDFICSESGEDYHGIGVQELVHCLGRVNTMKLIGEWPEFCYSSSEIDDDNCAPNQKSQSVELIKSFYP